MHVAFMDQKSTQYEHLGSNFSLFTSEKEGGHYICRCMKAENATSSAIKTCKLLVRWGYTRMKVPHCLHSLLILLIDGPKAIYCLGQEHIIKDNLSRYSRCTMHFSLKTKIGCKPCATTQQKTNDISLLLQQCIHLFGHEQQGVSLP